MLKNQVLLTIPGQKMVKFTDMGNVKEIMYIEKVNLSGFPVKKINKNEYVWLETGEIGEYAHSKNRSENRDSLRQTFKKIRGIINTNFNGSGNELIFTITYKLNMTDTKRLYNDFRKFIKRLRYRYPNIDYISVVEPQERGAWHCHVLLKFNDLKKIYIPNKDIEELWGNGFVKVKAIKNNVDNMGAYLSAYLGDIEIHESNAKELMKSGVSGQAFEVKEVVIDGKSKMFIKGGRLYLYPVGMNIFRKSKGIREPVIIKAPYDKVKKIIGVGAPIYGTCTKILDDDGKILNSITYEQYNIKRQLK
mgnify:CR=1 FL=1